MPPPDCLNEPNNAACQQQAAKSKKTFSPGVASTTQATAGSSSEVLMSLQSRALTSSERAVMHAVLTKWQPQSAEVSRRASAVIDDLEPVLVRLLDAAYTRGYLQAARVNRTQRGERDSGLLETALWHRESRKAATVG
jgi:hypothetical protein